MKFLAFSDLHVHTHRFGASVDPETGRHSRLQHCLDVLENTHLTCVEEEIPFRFFCGDMFHVRGKLSPSIINPVFEHFSQDKPYRDILLVGNHDMEHRSEGEHALKLLSPFATVLEDHGCLTITDALRGSFVLGWVAYEPDVKELKRKVEAVAAMRSAHQKDLKSIFLLHHGVDGAMDGIPDMGFGPTNLPHEEFDVILCGDYHQHKELIPGKAWMIGAPLQHTFGDVGQRRGWMQFDLVEGTHVHVQNDAVPKFVSWDEGAGAFAATTTPDMDGNFVRIRHSDAEMLSKREDIARKNGAIAVQSELLRKHQKVERADLQLSMTPEQLFLQWLESDQTELSDDDKSELVKFHKEALDAAGIVS